MIHPFPESIFFELNEHELKKITDSAERIQLERNTCFIEEGAHERSFYYLIEGNVKIVKHSGKKTHTIATLTEGESIGEMVLIDNAPRSASAIALTPCQLYKFDIDQLNNNPDLTPILNTISSNISKKIANRLRYTNNVTLEALKSKFVMSIFFIRIIILLSLYALSLSLIEHSKQYFTSTTFLSVGLIVIFTLVIFSIIRQSGNPYRFYGFTMENALKNFLEAVVFTIPILLTVLCLKWIAITYVPSLHHLTLFDHTAIFSKGSRSFSWDSYFLFMSLYALFCPVQEFIVRGCIQTSLQSLMEGTKNRVKWNAILISNLLFASAHSHTSLGFALSVFIPGLFWGWLYDRQRSLIGVSISHILIGVWSAFIVGFENIFR